MFSALKDAIITSIFFCTGVVRYIGPAEFGEGVWVGVELRTAKGKNDGSVHDKRYFTCRPDHGLLVRPSKITVRGINGAKLITDYYGSKESSPMEEKWVFRLDPLQRTSWLALYQYPACDYSCHKVIISTETTIF